MRCARRVRRPRRAARRPVRRAAAGRLRARRRRAPRRRGRARPAARSARGASSTWSSRATSTPRPRAWAARSPPTSASGPRACTVGDCAFDLVRARAESYAHPGALPDVRPGTLEDDLRRRDVTVNAIALRLDGTLAAVDGRPRGPRGRRAARAARRVVRRRSHARVAGGALRGAPGVRRSSRTRARWPAAADPTTVSGDRHGAELRLALAEPDPLAALQAVAELNPAYLPEGFDPGPRALAAALDLLPDDGRARPAHPGRLHRRDGHPRAAGLARRHGLRRGRPRPGGRRVALLHGRAAACGAHQRRDRPRRARRAGRGGRAGRGRERAPLAGRPARRAASRSTATTCSPPAMPQGPEIGARLQRALDRKLDGEIAGREQELATALDQDGG